MITELSHLDATAQADLVRNGDTSPIELVDAAIARVEKLNGELNAVIHPLFERARRAAAGELPDGPFRGVPILVKDFDGMLEGAPYHAGNRALHAAGYTAPTTSYLFQKLERAGFVIIGKANTPEFGLMPTAEPESHGPTRNPWDPTRSSGGSSGGSAAAVASGMVPVAHAGDGGGSIRIPASMCGLFGLKPSRGRVSLGPDESEGWGGLVVRHVVARSVRDSARILDLLQGYMTGDYYTAPPPTRPYADELTTDPGPLRVAIRTVAPASIAPTDPACVAAAEDAARLLETLGHTVEVASPAALDEAALLESFSTIMFASLGALIADTEGRLGRAMTAADVEALTWMYRDLAQGVSGAAYIEAIHEAQRWTRRVVSWWSETGFDLLLTPTLAEPPPEIGDVATRPDDPFRAFGRALPFAAYTAPFNITGQPAVSLPTAWTDGGLPVGVQLVAAPFREDLLVRLSAQVEAARPWAERRPPIHASAVTGRAVTLAGGQGFYGDTPAAADALLAQGVDFLCLEALAELTLAILQKDRQRDETRGCTRDLPAYLSRALPYVAEGRTKAVTNAGGINPAAAARAAIDTARSLGISGITVATVLGDDLLPRLDDLHAAGEPFAHLDTGASFGALPAPPLFASAYLGARPIADALAQGADVVITGRVADASLFLGPLAYAHEWRWDDWDRLAAGTLVGHLLECSGQSLGGNYSGDWWALPHPWDLPYPIADVTVDGTATIRKPEGSGGRVSTDTIRHQLLYEVHDPARYLSPDVVADFTSAHFEDLDGDRVRVTEVRGTPATDTYKLLLSHHAGWAGESRVAFSWPDAYEKAKATAAIFVKRVEMAALDVEEWCVEYWGVDALGGPTVPPRAVDDACEPPECVLRVAWRCADQRTAGLVGRELVPLTLSAPPAGLTGAGRGAGGATELLAIWPTLVSKHVVDAEVRVVLEEVH